MAELKIGDYVRYIGEIDILSGLRGCVIDHKCSFDDGDAYDIRFDDDDTRCLWLDRSDIALVSDKDYRCVNEDYQQEKEGENKKMDQILERIDKKLDADKISEIKREDKGDERKKREKLVDKLVKIYQSRPSGCSDYHIMDIMLGAIERRHDMFKEIDTNTCVNCCLDDRLNEQGE